MLNIQTENILAFDFGTKYIGVALGDNLIKQARPLTSIMRKNKTYDWQQIHALIEKWRPLALVVGKPLTLEGGQQEIGRLAEKFANQLRGRFTLEVYEVDERLTSRLAQAIIRDTPSLKRRSHKEKVDQVSAQLILQTWFDSHD